MHDPNEHARQQQKTHRRLEALIEVLSHFEPLSIYDQSGLVIEVLGSRAGRDFAIGFPYQCFDAGVAAADQIVLVYLHSHLLRSLRVTDFVTMTGLNFPFRVESGDKIWLEIPVMEGVVDTARVRHGPVGWAGFPEPVAFSGEFPNRLQTFAYVLIAYAIRHDDATEYDPPGVILGRGTSAIMLVNVLRNHLLLAQTCYQGDTVLYPMPWSGAFIQIP